MNRKKIILGIRIFVAISLLTQIGIFIFPSFHKINGSIHIAPLSMNFFMLFIAFSASWLEGPLGGLRTYYIMKVINPAITYKSAVKASYGNLFLGAATPSQTGGGVAEIYFITRDDIPISEATAGTIMTFICTLFFLTIALFVVYYFQDQAMGSFFSVMIKTASIMMAVATGIFLISVIFTNSVNRAILFIFYRLKASGRTIDRHGKIEHRLTRICEGLLNYRGASIFMCRHGKRAMCLGFIFTCLFFATRFIIPYFIVRGLGMDANLFVVMYIQLLITLITYFSPTPGGSGLAEISSLVLMASFVTDAIAPLYTILWRFSTLYVNVFIGGVLLLHELQKPEQPLDE
ncbi:MAG: YbhN family protein [Thermodesulfobacteriota bacterium]